jgi:hypothetical protein
MFEYPRKDLITNLKNRFFNFSSHNCTYLIYYFKVVLCNTFVVTRYDYIFTVLQDY